MSKNRMRMGAAALASAAMLGAGAALAGAATPAPTTQTLSGIQAQAAAAVSLRVDDLDAAISKVNADPRLGADGGALAAYLNPDLSVSPGRSPFVVFRAVSWPARPRLMWSWPV